MIEENKENPIKKIVIGMLVLFFLLVPATIYIYVSTTKKDKEVVVENIGVVQKEITNQDKIEMGKMTANSTNENISDYIISVDQQIAASGTSKLTKDVLLLRKAMAVAINRNSDFTKNQMIATDMFISLVNNSVNDNATSTYIKNYATIALIKLHNECCTNTDGGHDYLFDRNINGYTQTYQGYVAKGYPQGLSKLLALNDLSDTVTSYTRNDVTFNATTMDIISRILYIYIKDIDTVTKKNLTERLGSAIENAPNLKVYTYTDYISTLVLTKSIYAFALDTYLQQTKTLDIETNKRIDQNYEDLAKLTAPNADQIGLNQVKFYNYTRYAHSLNRRYGKNIEQSKLDKVIKDMLLLINSSKEMQESSKNYFKSPEIKNGTFLGAYFVSLRTTNKELDTYFKSIGI